MPELPEVETIRAELEPAVTTRTIGQAESHPSTKFTEAVHASGAGIESLTRRGKYLLFGLDDDRELIVHLGMTGQLQAGAHPWPHDDYVRARWPLDDGSELVYRDVRRFGRIRVVPAGDYSTITTLAQLGPEPFDPAFTPDHLHRAIRASSRRIKTQLLGQRPVAGLGNIYADEALWQARVYPGARKLSRPAAERLHLAIVDVLRTGIENRGTTLRDYRTASGEQGTNQFSLRCYGRSGEPCDRCATTLRSRDLDGRTTTWCPSCQHR